MIKFDNMSFTFLQQIIYKDNKSYVSNEILNI